MAPISCVTSSFPVIITPSKLLRGGLVHNTPYFYDFRPSKISGLQVKVDNSQDTININNFGKIMDHKLWKRRYTQDEYIMGQNFIVRSYELDIHQKASLQALLNYTQETESKLLQSWGLVGERFGVSKEMTNRNLIWVIGRMQVEVNSYPSWGEVVQVESWCSALSKFIFTISSRLTNANTRKEIMRADREYVVINEKTRRLSKIPEEITAKGESYVKHYLDTLITVDKHDKHRKLQKLDEDKADYIVKGIKPLWFDLDLNQHVNNAKYISWILEGTPKEMMKNYELAAIALEYRRECGREGVLHSLSSASNDVPHEFHHLLRLENDNEVARARTLWRTCNN